MISKSVKGGKGYLLIENRFNEQAIRQKQPDGSAPILMPAERTFEANTLTCAHCQAVVMLLPTRVRERGWCRKCNAYICDKPGCHAECNPIAMMVDLQIANPTAPIIERDLRGLPIFDLDRLKTKIY